MAYDNTYEYNPNLGNDSKKDDTGYNPNLGADDTGFNPNLGADDTGFNPNLGADDTGFNPNAGAEEKKVVTAAAEAVKEEKKDLEEAPKDSGKGKKKKFNSDEIAMFCDQIAMLLKGGISVYEGTYMLYSEMEDAKTKEVLRQIDLQVKENIPLYKALTATGAFPG